MTYDLHILRVDPGHSAYVALEDLVRLQDEPQWPSELTQEHLDIWDRIVRRVRGTNGPVTEDVFRAYAELSLRAPRIRLYYCADHATVRIPYWYSGEAALDALRCGYGIARIVAEETGFVAVDSVLRKLLP